MESASWQKVFIQNKSFLHFCNNVQDNSGRNEIFIITIQIRLIFSHLLHILFAFRFCFFFFFAFFFFFFLLCFSFFFVVRLLFFVSFLSSEAIFFIVDGNFFYCGWQFFIIVDAIFYYCGWQFFIIVDGNFFVGRDFLSWGVLNISNPKSTSSTSYNTDVIRILCNSLN